MNNKAQEKPDDGLAPCGCRVRFDNDGLIRLAQCNLHSAAPDLLEACKGLLGLVQSGRLVRDISKDGETDFALRQLPLVKALKQAQSAIEKASTQ